MSAVIYDLIILAILAAAALWGMHRGMIRTLFSLLAVLVAFVGALLLANLAAPAVAGAMEPRFAAGIEARLKESIQHTEYVADDGGVAQSPDEVGLPGVLEALKELGIPEGVLDSIRKTVEQGAQTVLTSAAARAAAAAARIAAFTVVFLAGFVLILIVWNILSRTLDLVARLPVLHTMNKLGGLLLGILRGAVWLFVLAWLVRQFGRGAIPGDAVENAPLLRFFMTSNPMDLLAKV